VRKTTGPWISGRGAFQPLASVEQLTVVRKTTGTWISGRGAFQPLASMEQLTGARITRGPWISGRNLTTSGLRGTVDRSEEDKRLLDLK
jgi:hypothetical protein